MKNQFEWGNHYNRRRGDIKTLKTFCAKTSDSKQKLVELISNIEKEQTSHKSHKEKVVSLGWVHLNKRKNKYCAVHM